MFNVILPRILWILGLILAQTLVFNHIHLMGYATPMPYVYALIMLPHGTSRWIYVVLGFALGLVVDTLSNTVGAAAGALTLVGLVTPLLLRAFAPDDKMEWFLEICYCSDVHSHNGILPPRNFLSLRPASPAHRSSE